MRVAVTLSGTDSGTSGLGTYIRAVLPHLAREVRSGGGTVVAMGTRAELDVYSGALSDCDTLAIPDAFSSPGASAFFHLVGAGEMAERSGADVVLLPAANRRLTARSPLPTVAVVHDLAQLRVREKYGRARMAYTRQVVLPALRTATRLVAISQATRDDLADATGVQRSSIRVVPNGVDVRRFKPLGTRDTAGTRAALGLDWPFILYVSRLEHPGKNHLRLLRAFAECSVLRTHDLVLAGPDWGAAPLIREEIARLGLHGVKMLGRVDDALLPGLMGACDAAVMVGLHEGFGLPALEALACGRPVLAARAGALPEVVGSLGVLCDPLDEASIASGLDRVTGDEIVRRRARDEGPLWAAGHAWEATAASLVEACVEARAA